jgi:signal peptidase I
MKNTNKEIFEETEKELDNQKEPDKKKKIIAILLDLVIYGLIIYVCLFFVPEYVLQRTQVEGPSMENTLHDDDYLMVEKISYHLDALKRFDIIVFYPYGRDNKEEYFVKRLIGLPGETIQIKGEDIYINGEVIDENYGKDPITYAGIAEEPITLGEDEYFVMGDNREISFDSRYEEVGVLSKKNIGGKAVLRVWPLNKFGFIK